MMLYDVDLPGGLEHVILLFLLVGQSLGTMVRFSTLANA
jgi:hypothetical protein